MDALTKDEMSSARKAFRLQKKNFTKRNSRLDAAGNRIEFHLSFKEWLDIWLSSGHFRERGKRKGQYCMSRRGDIGHYAIGNVFIQPTAKNIAEARTRERREKTGRWAGYEQTAHTPREPTVRTPRKKTATKERENNGKVRGVHLGFRWTEEQKQQHKIRLNEPAIKEKHRLATIEAQNRPDVAAKRVANYRAACAKRNAERAGL
jgi:hypothetical protein